jgi:LuxR family maltose regulon positive regulatory protein
MAARQQEISIIRTKLHRPSVAAGLLCRVGPHVKLDVGRHLPLTLVVAPAGYGKSTAITHRMDGETVPSARVSMYEGDNDLRVFRSYLAAAIRTFSPKAGDTAARTDASETHLTATLSERLRENTQ